MPSRPAAARALHLPVPFEADPVAPSGLVYGTLPSGPDCGERPLDALHFEIRGGGRGRVTFEGLDAVRAARGEHPPVPVDRWQPGDWVFTVPDSDWLRERHAYESEHYGTPLLETHRHYLFLFHDEYVEALAEGIWPDRPDPAAPMAPPGDEHPLAPFGPQVPAERFTSPTGITWELRRSPRPQEELLRGSAYCSQRLYQLNLVLEGLSSESAAVWLRTRDGVTVSRMTRRWTGETARWPGIAGPEDLTGPWEAHVAEVAARRRSSGR